ncbi:putative NADPH2 dehydrogenase chain OYE2 [Auriscalpium vulgare]|uniref:NADPH2 dehydrogenase chain OYE2 n=1 Tax=Auriscalpium vulgare TaxID=40419 RepID=A0ACB8RFJ2_9AGAM|nr:putative NADPH2 dehydrogenase chain OYE2 [Auriscalpium vulgare]
MSTVASSALFSPIRVGRSQLLHRVVLSPLTRNRANLKHEPNDLHVEYYKQRASVPGTLLITEATFIAAKAGGYPKPPGIWSEPQIAAWKKVTDAVHANGSFIYLQLWALGRTANAEILKSEGFDLVSAGDIALEDHEAPRPLSIEEIKEYQQLYATAASNAVHKAGFDGVEVHGANGYLVDQFLQTNTNNRTDEYGGSLENRVRFGLEVVDAVVAAVGADRTGIRLSPWSVFQGMRLPDPIPTFSHFVTRLRDEHPDLAYIHVVDHRVLGAVDNPDWDPVNESNQFLRDIWGDRPYIAAGGFQLENATETADKQGGLVAFGRFFISNPDLPYRLKSGIALNPYDRSTFYGSGPEGYIDYPFAKVAA